jgi:TatD DNase family protein
MAELPLRWIDDHCHLHLRGEGGGSDVDLEDHVDERFVADAVAAAAEVGVERMITVGCDVADSRAAIEAARRHPGLFATAGVHPHEAKGGIVGLEALLAEPEVVAVGECGLDFHYDFSPRDAQREVFAVQIALAKAHDLALVIHTREAWPETFDILEVEGMPERTVFHCFTGGAAEARRCLDLGAHLSISGIVTFKTATDIREATAICPPDRLLVETDSPYLAPVPHRGKRNAPALLPLVGEKVAEVQGRSVAEVAASTWDAAHRLYRLPTTVAEGDGDPR